MVDMKTPRITPTNLHVLRKSFASADSISARVPAGDFAHLARCLKAGLLAADGEQLSLTDAGREALA